MMICQSAFEQNRSKIFFINIHFFTTHQRPWKANITLLHFSFKTVIQNPSIFLKHARGQIRNAIRHRPLKSCRLLFFYYYHLFPTHPADLCSLLHSATSYWQAQGHFFSSCSHAVRSFVWAAVRLSVVLMSRLIRAWRLESSAALSGSNGGWSQLGGQTRKRTSVFFSLLAWDGCYPTRLH